MSEAQQEQTRALAKSAANGTAVEAKPAARAAGGPTALSVMSPEGYQAAMRLAHTLVESGFLPRGIDRPAKALAVILAGQEMGLPPMLALRSYHFIEGKPTLSANAQLEMFRRRGGRSRWVRSDAAVAELWLHAPNGDEHTETVTLDEMRAAGVATKDNWKRYQKSMLRARAIAFGLRALGESEGIYSPDELGAVTDEEDRVVDAPPPRESTRKAKPVDVEAAPAPPPLVTPEFVEAPNTSAGEALAVEAEAADTGEASEPHEHDRLRDVAKQLGWPKTRAVNWLKKHFGVTTVESLSKQQAADCLTLLLGAQQGEHLYDRVLAELAGMGRVKP
ncbi:MAG TPA: hypothetical protein VD931_16375 [Baekduia sp.]|nr:hypothetical protein [Baekduia sp.]